MLRAMASILAFLIGIVAAGGSVAATASDWERNAEAEVRLVSAVAAAGDLRELPLGLQFKLKPGWKTYWRAPGSGGIPLQLDWTGSQNLAGAELLWPAPKRFSILGIDSVGYSDEVVLPLAVRPETPGQPVRLRLALDYLTCDEICIPQRAALNLTIGAGAAEPTPYAHLIDRYRGRIPGPPTQILSIAAVELVGFGVDSALRVSIATDRPLVDPDLFVEAASRVEFGRPRWRSEPDGRSVIAELPVKSAGDAVQGLVGNPAVITLTTGERALEQRVEVAQGVASVGLGLVAALGLALLGGLVLNFMPCVLPVLSIKLLSIVGHGGRSAASARRSFLATAAGILVSFLLLAGAAATIKAAGVAVGWGIQFQQPWFLAAMTLLMLLFTANLWGIYEIRLPAWAGSFARSGPDSSLAGAFVTGILATLLATPCSAPFVGTAVGFALAGGAGEIFAIFAALGVGLALPYLVVAAAPRLATRLPRPGRWMVTLRRILGLLMLGTAVWLLLLLAMRSGPLSGVLVFAAATAVIAMLWTGDRLRPALKGLLTSALVILVIAVPELTARDHAPSAGVDPKWLAFDRARIAELVAEGRTVFVDVTAEWCITCQVNKAAVLRAELVADRLAAPGVVAVRADWTRPNEDIARYLAAFGRYGIPFNAVYGPGAPAGIALPELLTTEAVLSAIDRASRANGAQPTS